jgi:hypothetical protein
MMSMNKRCVCGKVITSQYDLCNYCAAEYGLDRSKWEQWLVFLVADLKRERRQAEVVGRHEVSFTDIGIY